MKRVAVARCSLVDDVKRFLTLFSSVVEELQVQILKLLLNNKDKSTVRTADPGFTAVCVRSDLMSMRLSSSCVTDLYVSD